MTVKELIEKLQELPEDMQLDGMEDINIPEVPYTDPVTKFYMSDACRNCPNHPSHGGSGICHCILGTQTQFIE